MSVWQTSSVEVTPEIVLTRWSIYEVMPWGSFHFVGVNITEGGEGRVSSAIRSFDIETKLGVTDSGRIYELRGSPGANMDALYVWSVWKKINKVDEEKEVDLDYLCSKLSVQQEEN